MNILYSIFYKYSFIRFLQEEQTSNKTHQNIHQLTKFFHIPHIAPSLSSTPPSAQKNFCPRNLPNRRTNPEQKSNCAPPPTAPISPPQRRHNPPPSGKRQIKIQSLSTKEKSFPHPNQTPPSAVAGEEKSSSASQDPQTPPSQRGESFKASQDSQIPPPQGGEGATKRRKIHKNHYRRGKGSPKYHAARENSANSANIDYKRVTRSKTQRHRRRRGGKVIGSVTRSADTATAEMRIRR